MTYRDDERDLLNDLDKGVKEARGVLSVLWRQLLMARSIDGWQWDKLMRDYLADPRNGIQNNSRDRSSARGNLNKELKRDDMTWRVFLKALNFLGPVRVVFTVDITFKDGTTTSVHAKLKDRGSILPRPPSNEDEDEVGTTGNDPIDDVDELMTTEHRPTLRRQQDYRPYTPDDMINVINANRSKR